MRTPICHIVTAGPNEGLSFELEAGDMLIAADGGYMACIEAGYEPDLFVGDMDSLPAEKAGSIDCECIELPREKDDTDTMSACKIAMIRGYEDIRIHNALGGDVGHEIANIQLLAFLHNKMVHCVLYGKGQEIHYVTPIESPASFEMPSGTRVSVFSFGDSAQGVFERGLYWELEDATMTNDVPIGVSNMSVMDTFEVEVEHGALIVVIG